MRLLKTLAGVGSLLCAAVLSSPAVASTNFVINGSFEVNSLTPGQRWGVFDTVNPWYTVNGAGIEIQRNGTVVDAHDGTYYVELDSHNFGDGPKNLNSNSTLGQTLFGLDAGSYELAFYYRPRTNNTGDNGIIASIGGEQLVLDYTTSDPGGNQWQLQTLNFVLDTAGDHDLTFAAFGTENTLGGFIDNVSVVAVPEPATWLMMVLGFAATGLMTRRRNRKPMLYC